MCNRVLSLSPSLFLIYLENPIEIDHIAKTEPRINEKKKVGQRRNEIIHVVKWPKYLYV